VYPTLALRPGLLVRPAAGSFSRRAFAPSDNGMSLASTTCEIIILSKLHILMNPACTETSCARSGKKARNRTAGEGWAGVFERDDGEDGELAVVASFDAFCSALSSLSLSSSSFSSSSSTSLSSPSSGGSSYNRTCTPSPPKTWTDPSSHPTATNRCGRLIPGLTLLDSSSPGHAGVSAISTTVAGALSPNEADSPKKKSLARKRLLNAALLPFTPMMTKVQRIRSSQW